MIIRKLKSAARVLGGGGGFRAFMVRTQRNLRQARLAVAGKNTLFYRHASGCRFLSIPGDSELEWNYLEQNLDQVESSIIRHWTEAGDCLVDCGAHLGLLSALMARQAGETGHILAIEASPLTFAKLQRIVATLNLDQVTPLPLCISDHEGETSFDASAENTVFHGIACDQAESPGLVTVPCASLDSILGKWAKNSPSLVKIDVEGAEPLVLRGAAKSLSSERLPLVIIEVYPRGLKRLGFKPEDIMSLLPEQHFELWHIDNSYSQGSAPLLPRAPVPLPDPRAHDWPELTNVVAIPKTGVFAGRREKLSNILKADVQP